MSHLSLSSALPAPTPTGALRYAVLAASTITTCRCQLSSTMRSAVERRRRFVWATSAALVPIPTACFRSCASARWW